MKSNYFTDCKDIEQAKKIFRELCFKLHPDKTKKNTNREFAEMHSQFEDFIKNFRFYTDRTGKQSQNMQDSINDMLKDIIQQIIYFDNCKIEIIGSWIWISGGTYTYKTQLKELKFWFSKNKKAWYYNGSKSKRKIKGRYTLEQIRNMHGCYEIENQCRLQLA